MLEELKEEAIVNKVGGRFKLSTLIQKRLIALNKGAKPLVDLRTNDKMAIVIQEILQDKIYLDSSGNVQARNQTALANLPANMFNLSDSGAAASAAATPAAQASTTEPPVEAQTETPPPAPTPKEKAAKTSKGAKKKSGKK